MPMVFHKGETISKSTENTELEPNKVEYSSKPEDKKPQDLPPMPTVFNHLCPKKAHFDLLDRLQKRLKEFSDPAAPYSVDIAARQIGRDWHWGIARMKNKY